VISLKGLRSVLRRSGQSWSVLERRGQTHKHHVVKVFRCVYAQIVSDNSEGMIKTA